MESLGQPVGSVMLSTSAIDAMLKVEGYTEGTLYARIDKAAEDHVITDDMVKWAHQVRLDANDQRHADEGAGLPTSLVERLHLLARALQASGGHCVTKQAEASRSTLSPVLGTTYCGSR
jgi:hypothetical protein